MARSGLLLCRIGTDRHAAAEGARPTGGRADGKVPLPGPLNVVGQDQPTAQPAKELGLANRSTGQIGGD